VGELAVGEPGRLASAIRPTSSRLASSSWRSSTISAIWSTNHGSYPNVGGDLVDRRSPASQAFGDGEDPIGRRDVDLGPQSSSSDIRRTAISEASAPNPKWPFSRLRSAFWSASGKVRPIAIASPTLRIEVPSRPGRHRELGEVEAGGLDHHVVERRLEAGGCGTGDVVGDLVEREPDRQQGGDLGDGKARWPSRPAPTSATPAGSSR
jgi:hypothetical protein